MKKIILATVLLGMTSAASAVPVTFFGEDTSTAGIALGANSQIARDAFLGNLVSGIGVEDFESFATNTPTPLNVSFPGSSGSLTASLTGSAKVDSGSSGNPGRFATSGTQFLEASTGSFTIDFSTGISAFGFNGIDIGDFVSAQMTLGLAGGGTMSLTVPHSLGIGNYDNSTLFFGFYDLTSTYTSITFNNAGGGDLFAFDDMIIGDLGQIDPNDPNDVPEPSTIFMFGLGLLSLNFLRRRKI